ncbi:hypothetical protein TRFO_19000 [Tritrichomonas foetus]|uniref:Uncharacterized protein n=1 Tax=Tritrichomonas foetus TaxID=1144522 RepID=A0A1J4KK92_9EUKA|nr:hypothetical protein TRFO_19000 [Tritrichomonas foetus]|eukprot:OHT11546.1 hypothetical protein TRFO_19000 [Tritrichomonas foetus]
MLHTENINNSKYVKTAEENTIEPDRYSEYIMFSFGPTKANRKRPDWVLIINQHECSCVKAVAAKLSPIIKTFLKNNPNAKNFECEINDCEIDRDLISMLFFGKEIQFSRNNVDLLTKIAKGLEMTELHRDLANYQEYLHFIEDNIDRSYEINELIQCEEIIFNFSPYAIDACITNSLKFLNPYNEDVFARTLLSYCVARHYRIEQAVEFLVKLDKKLIQKNQNSIAAVFCNLVLREFKKEISSDGQRYDEYRSILQELCFIIYQLMLKNLIDSNALQQDDLILPLFFAHLMTPEKIQLAQKANIINKEDRYPSFTQIIKNVNIKDWTPAHLYNAGTGVNTFPMLLYIRQDNIEKFSQYAKTPQFKVDEKVLSNIYERCTFINDKPKLLEYAAFFGSKECFKFLLASGAEKTPGILRFAICSGNSDIIKLCDSPICTLLGSLSLAVEYHHQVVSEWLIEVKNQSCFDPIVIQNCLRFCNFHMLSYILKKGVNANLFLLEAVHYDNIPATKWLLEIKGINVNQQDTKRGFTPLHYAAQSGNIKIIGLLLGTNGIHINSRTVFNLMFHFGVLYHFFI